MIFKNLRPILWTNNVEDTIRFYEGLLGFNCGEKNDGWGWAALHRNEVEIMIAKPNQHTAFNKPIFTGSFYMNIDNVDEL